MSCRRIREWFTVPTEPPIPRHEWYAISPAARGDYLEVYRVAIQLGRAGVIPGAGDWTTAQWRAWGLTRARVDAVVSAGLCRRIGGDSSELAVNFFDVSNEVTYEKQVESGRETARSRGNGPRSPGKSPSGSSGRDPRSEIRDQDQDQREMVGGGRSERPPPPPTSTNFSGVIRTLTEAAKNACVAANLDEIDRYGDILGGIPKIYLLPAYEHFLSRDGRDDDDFRWRDRNWRLHDFCWQALIPTLRQLAEKYPEHRKDLEAAGANASAALEALPSGLGRPMMAVVR